MRRKVEFRQRWSKGAGGIWTEKGSREAKFDREVRRGGRILTEKWVREAIICKKIIESIYWKMMETSK